MKKYYKSQCFVYVLGIDGIDMRGGKYRDFEDRLNQVHVISTQNKGDTYKHLEKTYRQNKKIDEYLRW